MFESKRRWFRQALWVQYVEAATSTYEPVSTTRASGCGTEDVPIAAKVVYTMPLLLLVSGTQKPFVPSVAIMDLTLFILKGMAIASMARLSSGISPDPNVAIPKFG